MTLTLTKISETPTKITLGWTPVPGCIGYRFQSAPTAPKWSHTWDATKDRVTFSKAAWYKVEAIGTVEAGEYPSVAPPPPPPPPPPGDAPPPYSEVGAKGTLTDHPGGTLSGVSLSDRRFTGSVKFGSGDVTLTNCLFAGGLSTTYPDHGRVTLIRCTNLRGWWFENGGHGNVFLDHCLFENNPLQAIRPKGPPAGPIVATDSWFRSYGQPADTAHTEAMQTIAAMGIFTRCAFSQGPVTNNTVTAVVNQDIVSGDGGIYTDCIFGAYYPDTGQWKRGGGYYMVYPGRASFIRPTIYSAAGTAQNSWYTTPLVLQDPTYIAA
jgi:hypothetical protein